MPLEDLDPTIRRRLCCSFHFILLTGDYEPSGLMFERVEPRRAGVAFLEGSDFAFDDGSALEDAFFNALAKGCGSGEESLLGACNHGLPLDAALGAAAQDQVARGVLGIGDFFTSTRCSSERPGNASKVSWASGNPYASKAMPTAI